MYTGFIWFYYVAPYFEFVASKSQLSSSNKPELASLCPIFFVQTNYPMLFFRSQTLVDELAAADGRKSILEEVDIRARSHASIAGRCSLTWCAY